MLRSYGDWRAAVEGAARMFVAALAIVLAPLFTIGTGQAQTPAAAAKPLKVVVLGDSLSAGYGLPAGAAFPARLQSALRAKGIAVDIDNAGVSGDTSSGGLGRLDWSVPDGTDAVILELGANDALRGIDPDVTRKALGEIIQRLQARHISVLLCGMLAPPNYGAEYAARFNAIYPDLAKQFGVPLDPFFLDGVAADAALNQADGMHPTAAGVDRIVARILPVVEAFLGNAKTARE
ncbi:MAG: arylesterase [Rhizobiales bacterium]|nr:arylesterase [Hyphomicrobiales bacterium]MBN8984683.1 arylesterase [Hyphomicrobiales bacterium]